MKIMNNRKNKQKYTTLISGSEVLRAREACGKKEPKRLKKLLLKFQRKVFPGQMGITVDFVIQ